MTAGLFLALLVPGISFSQTPANNAFTNRIQLSGTEIAVQANNLNATAEPGEPAHAGSPARRSLWWSWQSPRDGVASLLVTNVGGIPRLRTAVYSGSVLTNLTLIANSAAVTNLPVTFPVSVGETYQIAVDEKFVSSATAFTFRLSVPTMFLTHPAPESVIALGSPVQLAITNIDPSELVHVNYYSSNTFLGTTLESPFNFSWTPTNVGRMNLSAIATNSLGERKVSPHVWVTVTPANDRFTNASVIPAASVADQFNAQNAFASAETNEPAHAGIAAKSLWWRWTPAYSGRASFKLVASGSAPALAIYTGDTLTNLSKVISTNRTSVPISFEAIAGTTYFIATDGNYSPLGTVKLDFSLTTLRLINLSGNPVLNGDSISLTLTNFETDHVLTNIDLLLGTNIFASAQSEPWSFSFVPGSGQYVFSLRATNSLGELRISDPITIIVSPTNDSFASAVVISSLANAITTAEGTTAFATIEADEPLHGATFGNGSTWFSWVAPWSGDISFSAAGSQSCSFFIVYEGTSLTNLTPLTARSSFATATVVEGQKYFIAANSAFDCAGHIRLSIYPPPANNDFATAFELTGVSGTFSNANFSADSEPGEPVTGSENSASIWWRWTAPTLADFEFNAAGSLGMTVQAAVYSGSTVSNLIPVLNPYVLSSLASTGSGASGNMRFRAQPGTYYLRFSGGISPNFQSFGTYGNIVGSYSVTILPDVPSNDNFANRISIIGLTNLVTANNTTASIEPGEPRPPSCDSPGQTVWWSYTAPEPGMLRVWAGGELPKRVTWTVFTGTNLTQLERVNSSCELPIDVNVAAGDVLQIAVDGAFGKSGPITLTTTLYTAPTNDHFADRILLDGTNLTFSGNNYFASLEPDETKSSPGNTGKTLWYSWAAPFTGQVNLTSSSSHMIPNWGIYVGPSLDKLTLVKVSTGRNATFLAIEGTVYHFQIDGGGIAEFSATLSASPFLPPTNDNFADATLLKGGNTASSSSVFGATLELGEPLHVTNQISKSLWWKWQAPVSGNASLNTQGSLATNITLVAYSGSSLATLTRVASGPSLFFSAKGGTTYYIAAVVREETIGNVVVVVGNLSFSPPSVPVAGNLLCEASFEGTGILGASCWQLEGSIGGFVNENGGADGRTWPVLGGGGKLSQPFTTVPGHNYQIRFAYKVGGSIGGGSGPAQIRVLWNNVEIGIVNLPEDELSYWHWTNLVATASNSTSLVTFENLARAVEVDAFSVLSLSAPPKMVTQPVSASIFAGGSAALIAGAEGAEPLVWQWFFNGAPLTIRTSPVLLLDSINTNQSGVYFAIITNAFGSVTSAPATLVVHAPSKPEILSQPYGELVGEGGYFNFSVVAAGTPPLTYQWSLNGEAILGATNKNLAFAEVTPGDAGSYYVTIANFAGTVRSLSATLAVTNAIDGGGKVLFRNKVSYPPLDAPVFDVDGFTRLNGSNFVAQLYAGSSLALLRPVGQPSMFQNGFNEGYFMQQTSTIPTVPPGSNAVVQVRVWEKNKGSSYEEARAFGGKFGKSDFFTVMVGGGLMPPQPLTGLESFSVRAGLPQLTTGIIQFVAHGPEGFVLSHQGEPSFRYVIEKSVENFNWLPFLVLTNLSGTETFTDANTNSSPAAFYRSRILD